MKSKSFLILVFIFSCSILYSQNDINQYRNIDITKDEIYSHIKYLSSDELEGRMAGSNGDKLAEDYIGKEFSYYNLVPAGDSLYFQKFPLKSQVEFGNNNSLELLRNDKSIKSLTFGKDFSTLRISSSGKVQGNMVFAGYGIYSKDIQYNDYKDSKGNDVNVEGKIVVILDGSPSHKFPDYEALRYKAFVAKSKKAAGMIVVYPPNSAFADELLELSFDRESKNAGLPIMTMKTSLLNSYFNDIDLNSKEVQTNLDNLKPFSMEFSNSNVIMETSIVSKDVITANVIGYLEGNDPVLKNEVIVIGAHFDHLGYGEENSLYTGKTKMIHHGADDNASGSAGVMELAEKISSNKDNLKRSYLFICFSGEEEGLLGSAYFTKSNLFNKYNIISMINLDMIGRLNSNNTLVVSGTGSSGIWDSLLTVVNTQYNFSLSLTPEGMGGSDQTSFYLKNKPVLFFFTGLHADYHKPTDTYDKINTEGEAKILDLVYDVTMSLDKLEMKPVFKISEKPKVETEKKEEKKGYGKVYTGTIPDFSENVEGYKISGVNADSPAEKAGLKGGDVIIKFGDREIKSITDYTYALGEHKPGDELDVIVKRGDETLNLKMTLGTRK
jgi:hypothetical protein